MNELTSTSVDKDKARSAIRKIAGTENLDDVNILFAEVESVDMDERTCTVIPISGSSDAKIEGVSLSIDRNDGEIKKPKVGSTVGVATSKNIDPFVIAWSDIDEIILKGGNYNGLVKVKELTEKLNNLENAFNQHLALYNAHTHPVSGAVTLIPAAIDTNVLVNTTQTEIENKTIKHGNK